MIILAHDRRKIVCFDITQHPTEQNAMAKFSPQAGLL